MSLPGLAVGRPVATAMFFLAVSLLGLVSLERLPLELMPQIVYPELFVSVNQRGLSPEQVERDLVVPLEGEIGRLEDVVEVTSTATLNRGSVRVSFEPGTDMKFVLLQVQSRVERLRPLLPQGAQISVQRYDANSLSSIVMELQILGAGADLNWLRDYAEEHIGPALEAVEGVAGARVLGGRQGAVEIAVDPLLLQAHRLSLGQLNSRINDLNRPRAYLGQVYDGSQALPVSFRGQVGQVRQLANLPIDPASSLKLGDVARIGRGLQERTDLSRVNGKSAVGVVLQKEDEANLIEVAARVEQEIARLNGDLASQGVEVIVTNSQAELMETALDTLKQAALAGLALGLGVLFLFLRNLRFVTVLLLAIPASLLATFNLMYAWDLSLNVLSLCGLALALGMLTDNSIVVMESIFAHYERGKSPLAAARDGTGEVSRAVIASTATTALVFLPVAFIQSDYQDTLRQLALSITFPLLASLGVALTLVPAVAARTLGGGGARPLDTSGLMEGYIVFLKTGLRHRMAVGIGVGLALLVTLIASFFLMLQQETVEEESRFTVYIDQPDGATLEATDGIVRQVEAAVEQLPGVERFTSNAQEGQGSVTVMLKARAERPEEIPVARIKELLDADLAQVQGAVIGYQPQARGGASLGGRGGGGGGGFGLATSAQGEMALIKGYDFSTLQMLAEDLTFRLEELEDLDPNSVRSDLQRSAPEIQVIPDPMALFDQDLRVNAVLAAIAESSREGTVAQTSLLEADGTEVPIEVRPLEDPTAVGQRREGVEEIAVQTPSGAYVPLGTLARVRTDEGRNTILRTDRARRAVVSYSFSEEVLDSQPLLDAARQRIRLLVQDLVLPEGYSIELIEYETDTAYYWMMGVAALLTYMVLAALFESMALPLIVFCTLPTAAIGSCWALILSGTGLSSQAGPMALLGFIVLIGIAVNNGIILIDAVGQLRQQGFRRERAVLAAGRSRVRPILMTSTTTLLGVLPLALEFGGDYEVWPPFAIAVVGGLGVSMVSTLILIPVAYMGLEQVRSWLRSIGAFGVGLGTAAAAAAAYGLHLQYDSLFWTCLLAGPLWVGFLVAAWLGVRLHRARRARAEAAPIHSLELRTLTKVYGAPGRFRQEWARFERRAERLRQTGEDPVDRRAVLDGLSWKLPLAGLALFLHSYFEDALWIFLVALASWGLAAHLLGEAALLCRSAAAVWRVCGRLCLRAARWACPPLFIAYVQWRLGLPSLSVAVAVVWLAALGLRYLGGRIRSGRVDPAALEGRLARLRRKAYSMAAAAPLSGVQAPVFQALYGVDLRIGRGIFGLLGPNGAGKTTLMRIVCQVLKPTSGSVAFNGVNSRQYGSLHGVIGYLPQYFGLYDHMSAYQYLDYRALLEGFRDGRARRVRVEACLDQVNLTERKDDAIGSFSGGMKQRVGIAQTLLHMPQVIVVDEPTAGLDPIERIRFRNLLARVGQERIVIFSTHIVEDIAGSCNRLAVLNAGRVLYQGTSQQMRQLAQGHIWEVVVDEAAFADLERQLQIITHMRTPAGIRVRFLARQGGEGLEARPVEPSLEDAYIHLLRSGRATLC